MADVVAARAGTAFRARRGALRQSWKQKNGLEDLGSTFLAARASISRSGGGGEDEDCLRLEGESASFLVSVAGACHDYDTIYVGGFFQTPPSSQSHRLCQPSFERPHTA